MKIRLCHDALDRRGEVRHKNLRGDIITRGIFRCEKRHTYVMKAVFKRGHILMAGEDF